MVRWSDLLFFFQLVKVYGNLIRLLKIGIFFKGYGWLAKFILIQWHFCYYARNPIDELSFNTTGMLFISKSAFNHLFRG